MQVIGEAIDAALDADDEEKADALQEEGDSLGEQLQGLEDRLLAYAPNVKAAAGAIVTLDRNPQAALAAVVHGMVQTVLQKGYYRRECLPLGLSLTEQNRLESLAPGWLESPAAVTLAELQKAVGKGLPQDSAELFAVLLATPQDALVRLLSVCAAASVDAVTPRATAQQPGAALAQAVGLDMAAWWQPTAEGYFKHVSKAVILDAVGEFAPDHVSRLAKLKKADIASEAERLVVGTEWMPAILRVEGPQNMATDEDGVTAEDGGTPTAIESADVVAA